MTDPFSNVFERNLQNKKWNFQVLNFGKAGLETVDHLRLLEGVVFLLDPDFILLQWYINDVEGHDKSDRPRSFSPLPGQWLHSILHTSSGLYYLIETWWSSMQNKVEFHEAYVQYMQRKFSDSNGWASNKANKAMQIINYMTKKVGVPLGIVLFPDLRFQIPSQYPFDFLHDWLLAQCLRNDIPCLDLCAVYSPFTGEKHKKRLWVNQFDTHPSKFANQLAVLAILDTFQLQWVIKH